MNLLQLGVKAHQAGDLSRAKQFYLQHLAMAPGDPNAKQLLGVIYSSTGQIDEAIKYISESLSVAPKQPHVWNNLGLCQKKKGMLKEATASFVQAIEQKPDYLEAYKHLVQLLLDVNQIDQATAWLNKGLSIASDHVPLLKLDAKICELNKNYPKAIERYLFLLKAQPQSIELKHNLAVNYRQNGQSANALALYEEIEPQCASQYQFFHNKGNALADLGKQGQAIDYYKKAIKLNPEYVESHVNLNELLWEMERNDEFLVSYGEAFSLAPANAQLRFAYVRSLLRISQYELALTFLQQQPDGFRQSYEYFELLGRALKGVGRVEDAVESQQKVLDFDDVSADAMFNYAETLLEADHFQRAADVVEQGLQKAPEDKYGWSLLGVAWEKLGDKRAATLNDYDNLVRAYTIEIPDGYDSVDAFCQDLENYLISLHTSTQQPLEQTLMGGTQTRGNLFDDKHPLIVALIAKLTDCVNRYIEDTRPYMGSLPVIRNSQAFTFSGSWSVRLKGKGYHTPHVHPMGWLSSAFYVQLPETVEDEDKKQGWFKLGEPNLRLSESPTAKKYIRPAVGKLVLFQSYMWHGTVPFETDETRTTVAFDVARKDG